MLVSGIFLCISQQIRFYQIVILPPGTLPWHQDIHDMTIQHQFYISHRHKHMNVSMKVQFLHV